MLSDAQFMVACTAAFTALFSLCILAGLAFWRSMLRHEESHMVGVLAAATNAGLHATVCTWWSFALLLAAADWTEFDAPNSPAHNMALCLSAGYFLAVSRSAQQKGPAFPAGGAASSAQPPRPPRPCVSLQDTLVYLIPFTPTEVVYIAHHAITVLFLAASLHLQKGAHAVLFGLWIGAWRPRSPLPLCRQQRSAANCAVLRTPDLEARWRCVVAHLQGR